MKTPIYRYNRFLHDRNLKEEIINIIASDIDNTCERIEDRGLIFLLTLLFLMPITIAEIIYCCWTYCFDKKDTGYTSLAKIWRDELSTAEGLANNICDNTEQQITRKFTGAPNKGLSTWFACVLHYNVLKYKTVLIYPIGPASLC